MFLYSFLTIVAFVIGLLVGKKLGFNSGKKVAQFETELRTISDTTRILLGKHKRKVNDCSEKCAGFTTELDYIRSRFERVN
jgi:hypothetical protein